MRITNESKTDRFAKVPGWFVAALALGISTILVLIAVMSARHFLRDPFTNDAPIAAAGPDMSPFFLEQRATRLSESDATRRVVYPFSIIPVSYTHLDVYKRQLYKCHLFVALTRGPYEALANGFQFGSGRVMLSLIHI